LRLLLDGVRGPVVGHQLGVVDRHQVGLCLEVPHRVAASRHDGVDEPVGGHDRVGWLINEAFLQVLPFLGETRTSFLG
jgi:hypothetical protein